MTVRPRSDFRVRALLFDMDGTLVDSTPVIRRVWERFAERCGLDPEKVLAACHGRRTIETIAEFVASADVEREVASVDAEELADVEGLRAIDGAVVLLRSLPRENWAIVTSAGRELAERRLRATGVPLPDVIVTAEDVAAGKPDPEGYVEAARRLGVSARSCMIFEDAPAGFLAARRSGAEVLAVTATHRGRPPPGEQAIADFTGIRVRVDPDRTLRVTVL